MGDGRRIHIVVVSANGFDIGAVARRHRQQISMAQHRAFGPAGGSAGIEQPCNVVFKRWVKLSLREPGRRRKSMNIDREERAAQSKLRQMVRHQRLRAAVVKDVLHFARMQLGVHGNDCQTAP
jgi:hypothetical protein